MEKSIFHQVPHAIKSLIIATLCFAIPFGRNNNFVTSLNGFIYNLIAVISAIRQQELSGNTVNQGYGLCAIRCGTRCNSNSDRHTMRIHGQVYFTVEPPFVCPMP